MRGAGKGVRAHVVHVSCAAGLAEVDAARNNGVAITAETCPHYLAFTEQDFERIDRKSTRLNSSHVRISYAVFCLKKKKTCMSLCGMTTLVYTIKTFTTTTCFEQICVD